MDEHERNILHARDFLTEQARLGSLVLFVGAGVSAANDVGLPRWSELVKPLAAKLGVEPTSDPLDIAQLYAVEYGRKRLLDYVRAEVGEARAPGAMHRSLARVPARVFFTTNYDQLLERALTDAQHVPPDVIVADAHVGLIDELRRTTVVKLHGCLSMPETIVLARDEYEAYAERHPAMIAYLQSLLATRTLLFVGTSLNDPNFRVIHAAIRRALGKHQRHAYVLDAGEKKEVLVKYWAERGIKMLLFPDYEQEREFIDAIGRAASEGRTIRAATMILARETPPPSIDPDWLLRGARDLEGALLRTIEHARENGLLSRERIAITEAPPDSATTAQEALQHRRSKVRALLGLAEAIDAFSPLANPDVWSDLGDALYALGDASGAIQAYNALLRPYEGRHAVELARLTRIRGNLARCYAREGHYERSEWLLRQCVFKAGQEVPHGSLNEKSVFHRLHLEHLEQRPTDATEFALAVSRRAERLREIGHPSEAFAALREARFVLSPLLGFGDYAHDCFSHGYAAGPVRRQWVPDQYSYPRAHAFSYLGVCYRLTCSLALDLKKHHADIDRYQSWAERLSRDASAIDPLMPKPYVNRLFLTIEDRLPLEKREQIQQRLKTDLTRAVEQSRGDVLIRSIRNEVEKVPEVGNLLKSLLP